MRLAHVMVQSLIAGCVFLGAAQVVHVITGIDFGTAAAFVSGVVVVVSFIFLWRTYKRENRRNARQMKEIRDYLRRMVRRIGKARQKSRPKLFLVHSKKEPGNEEDKKPTLH